MYCDDYGKQMSSGCNECLKGNSKRSFIWCRNNHQCWDIGKGLAFHQKKCGSSSSDYLLSDSDCPDNLSSSLIRIGGGSEQNEMRTNNENESENEKAGGINTVDDILQRMRVSGGGGNAYSVGDVIISSWSKTANPIFYKGKITVVHPDKVYDI